MRRLARVAFVATATLALVRCGEGGRYGTGPGGGGGGGGGGGVPGVSCTAGCPSVTILQPATTNFPVGVGDSVLVQFRASDDRGVVSVDIEGVALRGDPNFGTDTVVQRFEKRTFTIPNRADTTMARFLYVIDTDSTTESALIIVTATDSSGQLGADTTSIRLSAGPRLTIVRPNTGASASIGKSFTIEVTATDPQGVRVVGWRASGVLTRSDSIVVGGASLPDTVTFTDTLAIPTGTAQGNLVITGFAVDSTGDPSSTAAGVTVVVSPVASDATPPVVTFSVTDRIETDDSIVVTASDPSGITRVGYIVRTVSATPAIIAAESLNFGGNQTDVTIRRRMNLDTISTFPRLVTIEAFAIDSISNRGLSTSTGAPVAGTGTAAKDTVTVVAGRTHGLPAGGLIGEAIFNGNRSELYLSNLSLNRIEVFNVVSGTFLAGGVAVGSRPLGIAQWPRDTLGNYGDTIIVANSGGTNLSIVDMANRVERRRHRLPNYIVERVSITVDTVIPLVSWTVTQDDYSDRPQYLGAVCRNNCAQVMALYSTTPTLAQSQPNRGYMAWEELTASAAAPNGHLLYEVATTGSGDTIQVISVRDTAPGQARRDTIVGAATGVTASITQLVVQDSTYIRNSGDFNHTVMGEGGGDVTFARAFTYDSRAGMLNTGGLGCTGTRGLLIVAVFKCTARVDRGVSAGIFVRDFVANRASKVRSVATNFNGRTNFVRADSIYVMDFTLRQTGLLQVSGANSGMDVHPDHAFDAATRGSGGFGGTGSPNDRLIYTARSDANIEVFDTYWYGSVAQIPVRDPIIGPIRLARDAAGDQVLVGVTANGVVVVPLATPITNPFPLRAGIQAQPQSRSARRGR